MARESEAIFCPDQLIFLSSALASSAQWSIDWYMESPRKAGPSQKPGLCRDWWQKLEEGQKYGLPLPHLLKLSSVLPVYI